MVGVERAHYRVAGREWWDEEYAKPTAGRVARSAHGKGISDMSHSGTGPVVSFENVSKHYGSLKAVDGLSLDLRPGETVALLGPNGAGKSTSLDMLLALRKPTVGEDPDVRQRPVPRDQIRPGRARCCSPAG